MAGNNGPKIVRSGLITHLDVADKKSYAGSGATTWYDLSGYGEHYTLYNSPTFANNFGGELQFDGVNDYARRRNSNINTLLQGSFSIEMWIRSYTGTFYGSGGSGRFISVANDAGTGSDSTSTQGTDNDNTYFNVRNQNASNYLELGGWTGAYISEQQATFLNTDKYWQVVFTASVAGGGVGLNYYLNGRFTFGPLSWTKSPFSGNNNITLAMHSAGASTNPLYTVKAAYSIFKFYNRVLSASEILQNYNATKGRFGL